MTEKQLVLVIVLLLPSFLGKMVPPLAIYDFPPGLITVDKSSLSNTLNILKALRGTAPYLLILLVHNIRREWDSSIPARYLTSDGLRFNLDLFVLVEPKAQFIFWFLWVIFWLLSLLIDFSILYISYHMARDTRVRLMKSDCLTIF